MTRKEFVRLWAPSPQYGTSLVRDFNESLGGLIEEIKLRERRRAYRLFNSLGILSKKSLEIVYREEE